MKQGFFYPFPNGVVDTGLYVTLVKSDLAESVSSLVRWGYRVSQGGCRIPSATEIGNRGRPLALLLVIASFPAVALSEGEEEVGGC